MLQRVQGEAMNWIKRAWLWFTDNSQQEFYEKMIEEQTRQREEPPTHPNYTADDIKKDTSDFWDRQTNFGMKWNGMFEDLLKSDIERAKRKPHMYPWGCAWGAVIPVTEEKKMDEKLKVGDKVRHQSGVEGKIIQAQDGKYMPPSYTMFPTTKNVFQVPYTGPASEFTKIEPAPRKFKVGDRVRLEGEITRTAPTITGDECYTVKLDGSRGTVTRISRSEMSEATRVEHTFIPPNEVTACMAYNEILKSQNDRLVKENKELNERVENQCKAIKDVAEALSAKQLDNGTYSCQEITRTAKKVVRERDEFAREALAGSMNRTALDIANRKLDDSTCCVMQMVSNGITSVTACSKESLSMWSDVHGYKETLAGLFPPVTFGTMNPRNVSWDRVVDQVRKLVQARPIGYPDPSGISFNELHHKLAEKEKLIDEMIESMKKLEAQKNPSAEVYASSCVEREKLQRLLTKTKAVLSGERLKAMGLEERIKKFEQQERIGDAWEAELRGVLGIAGTKGVKIIDWVKSTLAAKSWAQYEPEIRTKERERIFRKLTSVHIGSIKRGFTIRQGVMTHELEFTEQALSDFLKEE
jgi:hypothetical protein